MTRMRILSSCISLPLLVLLLCTCPVSTKNVHGRHCGGTPKHVSIAVGQDPATSMIITFASRRSVDKRPTGGVLIGTDPDNLKQLVVESDPADWYETELPNNRGTYNSHYYHHITVKDLQPNTKYYYQPIVQNDEAMLRGEAKKRFSDKDPFKEDEEERQEEEEEEVTRRLAPPPYDPHEHGTCPDPDRVRSFHTAPPLGPDEVIRFAIVGDIGQFSHSMETMQHLRTHRKGIDAMMLTGDLAYPEFDEERWDTFQDFMDDYSYIDEVPMHITPGNHDTCKDEGGSKIFMAYQHRFRMPQFAPAKLGLYEGPADERMNMDRIDYPLPYEYGNAYYSFRYGSVYQIVLNSYSSLEPNSEQYMWFLNELASVDRAITPWLFVMYHVPVYNTFREHQKDPQRFATIDHVEPLLVENKVNMVFNGHVHAYLRTKNVAFGQEKKNGPVHIVVGAGGRAAHAEFVSTTPEEYVAVRDATWYGYGIVEVCNKTHLRWDWIHTGLEADHNTVQNTNVTLPVGGVDHTFFENQYYMTD